MGPVPLATPVYAETDAVPKHALYVRVINRSATAVEVDDVQMDIRFVAYQYRPVFNLGTYDIDAEFLSGEDRRKLEAFGGARWVLKDPLELDDHSDGPEVARAVRVRITLSNGEEVTGPWLSMKRMAATVEWRRTTFEQTRIFMQAINGPQQLTLPLDEPEPDSAV